ncbi:G protein-coupled receptor kinase-interactor 2-like isoform CRA_a, partial [Leptotrombidium deliense]
MSRKLKINHICADCGANEPNWASLNTGVLICDECSSIHRTLGRQVSQVKSLKRCFWAATELQMIRDLYSAGSNTIFEQNLVDANNSSFTVSFSNQKNIRRKPCAKDALHPTKEDFIRSKYQNLTFINRVHSTEETQTEINEQLHSSVRTPNLKTSLRLLILGANPNFVHPEKGNTPLIVSTKCGLILQVELLLVYGADPLIRDVNGKTAFDYA